MFLLLLFNPYIILAYYLEFNQIKRFDRIAIHEKKVNF
jgi:hypothetical protein